MFYFPVRHFSLPRQGTALAVPYRAAQYVRLQPLGPSGAEALGRPVRNGRVKTLPFRTSPSRWERSIFPVAGATGLDVKRKECLNRKAGVTLIHYLGQRSP